MRNIVTHLRCIRWLTFTFLAVGLPSFAVVTPIINYNGNFSVGGASYTGTAYFKFAIVDPTGTTNLWVHDGFSLEEPATSISQSVNKGIFSVNLGDTNIPNMDPILPSFVFRDYPAYLKIWASTNNTNFQLLSPTVQLTASPYAFYASVAESVANGSITAAKLAPGTVTGSSQLSLVGSTLRLTDGGGTNSVNLSSLVLSGQAYTTSNQTFIGANFFTNAANIFNGSFTGNASGLGGVWKTGGNNVANGEFIGSTNNQAIEF